MVKALKVKKSAILLPEDKRDHAYNCDSTDQSFVAASEPNQLANQRQVEVGGELGPLYS